MPSITNGNTVSDSSQIAPGVIVNSDIASDAAIDESKIAFATNDGSRHDHSAADITVGTLAAARGGTGVSSPTAKGVLVAQGASAMTLIAPGSNGQVIKSDGTDWAAGTPPGSKISTSTTDVEVKSTTTETTLYSFSVPGGTLGTNNVIHLRIWLKLLRKNQDTDNLTIRLKYGATTIASFSTGGLTSFNDFNAGLIEGWLFGAGTTSSQEGELKWWARQDQLANGGVIGSWHANGTATEDSTGALDFKITAQWNQNGNGTIPTIQCYRALLSQYT